MIFEDMSHLNVEVVLADRMRRAIQNTMDVANAVDHNLIALDPLYKSYDDHFQALLDMPNKAELIDLTTKMNGKPSLKYVGLKWIDVLKHGCPDMVFTATEDVTGKKISDVRDELSKVRGKGRLVISTRTAVTIIAREKAGDVEAFLEDIKPLKVKLHKSIILKLTTLKKKKS